MKTLKIPRNPSILSLPIAVLALAAVTATAVALAANPIKGAKYTGHLAGTATVKVSFKVDKHGKEVTGFKAAPFFPNACGAGGPPPKYVSNAARIKHGKFTTIVFTIPRPGSKLKAGKVTGTFLKEGRETGTLTPLGVPRSCTKAFKYSTTARKR